MAHFYGSVEGRAQTEASRLGTKDSGITTEAASWNGAIRVTFWHDATEDVDRYQVNMIPWNEVGKSRVIESGIVGVGPETEESNGA